MKAQRLPDSEFSIMQAIWEHPGPVTTGFVMDSVGHARGWKAQTVITLLSRLTERGFLAPEKSAGREKAYRPVISRDEYLRMETQSFMGRYHSNSVASLIASLAGEGLTDAELDELSAYIRQLKERGTKA